MVTSFSNLASVPIFVQSSDAETIHSLIRDPEKPQKIFQDNFNSVNNARLIAIFFKNNIAILLQYHYKNHLRQTECSIVLNQ